MSYSVSPDICDRRSSWKSGPPSTSEKSCGPRSASSLKADVSDVMCSSLHLNFYKQDGRARALCRRAVRADDLESRKSRITCTCNEKLLCKWDEGSSAEQMVAYLSKFFANLGVKELSMLLGSRCISLSRFFDLDP